jgi:uncharacterized repeat protein (TIGR03803 family)
MRSRHHFKAARLHSQATQPTPTPNPTARLRRTHRLLPLMKTTLAKLFVVLATALAVPAMGSQSQLFGYLTDVYGNGISGISISATDGLGDNYSSATTNNGYYSMTVVNGSYDVSVSCYQLNLQNYYCVEDSYPSISGAPAEADFTTTPVNTAVYPYTNLHSFAASAMGPNTLSTNREGFSPAGGLLLINNTLYGTAQYGGTNGAGTLFSINTNQSNFTVVHPFSAMATNASGTFTNSDGGMPWGVLTLNSNILYGTDSKGGATGNGTVFSISTNGAGFQVLHTFGAAKTNGFGVYTNNDGASPYAAVVLYSNILYGTAVFGCTNGYGAVFALNTNGSYSVLHPFTPLDAATLTTNSDGAYPYGGLILSGSTLYGTTEAGGSAGFGTIFAVSTNGTGFNVLHNFNGSDGANPYAGLVLVSNLLFGVTSGDGPSAAGTLFAVNTNGTGFTVLHSFTGGEGGATPNAALIYSNNTLYGTTIYGGNDYGGSSGYGAVYGFNLSSLYFSVLYAFTTPNTTTMTNSDGAYPYAPLALSGNILYGTATAGGGSGNGTLFAVTAHPIPTAPILSMAARPTLKQFQMLVAGQAAETYTVLVKTNINTTNWYSIFTTNASANTFLFTDPNATNGGRIYRVLGQ